MSGSNARHDEAPRIWAHFARQPKYASGGITQDNQAMAVDTARLLDSSANGYIAKPFSIKEPNAALERGCVML
ncbi:MAG: hypothetical protein QMB32_03875 [Burkholderiaceae bacterium]|tara:strand:- start:522 stop:740 length:219 start_codon:yes stop_codon:yes gene_type:complete